MRNNFEIFLCRFPEGKAGKSKKEGEALFKREAAGKYTGEGFFNGNYPLVSEKGILLDSIDTGKEKVKLLTADIGEGIKCSFCLPEDCRCEIRIREEWIYENYFSV